MSKKNSMGQTKRSTDDLINDAISQQNDWLENRREYTRGFLKSLNLFARPSDKKSDTQKITEPTPEQKKKNKLKSYWFPITCALIVIFIAVWVMFIRTPVPSRVVVVPTIPDPIIQPVKNYQSQNLTLFALKRRET